MNGVAVGSMVRVLHIPAWLIHDLPKDDQERVLATIGTTMTVTEIEEKYFWVGVMENVGTEVICSGWFILTADCFELVRSAAL
jgi:hypothetical protein